MKKMLRVNRIHLAGKVVGLIAILAFFAITANPAVVNSQDRLVVKDDSSETTFRVTAGGLVQSADRYRVQAPAPGFFLDETDPGKKGAYFVLDDDWFIVQRRTQGFGPAEAAVIFISIKAPNRAFQINADGNVGFGVNPLDYPLELANGAYNDGAWVDASSRDYKQDIKDLSVEEAVKAFEELKPVKFKYKLNTEEDQLGFIAEDVPELVATNDRKGMSPMDVVAVLTKVLQEQQKTITDLSKRIEELETPSK